MKIISTRTLKFIIISFLFLLLDVIHVYADEIKVTKFIPDNINYTINDGNLDINCSINDEGNYEIHGDMNTEGLEEGYYTSYIYENKNSDWSSFDGISFHLENMGEGPIDLNFSVICNDGTRYSISKENVMLVKRENSSIIERVHLPYGSVNINKGFIGTVYIPFESFSREENEKGLIVEKENDSLINKLAQVSSWGISITSKEDESKHFKISDFAFINSNQDFNSYLKGGFEITGDDNVVIPEAGEYIYQYGINNSTLKADKLFSISDEFNDIKISKEGLLTVGNNAEPQIITINALQSIDNSRTVGEAKSINLVRSWSHDRKYDDGISMAIPNEQNYSMSVSTNNIFINRIATIAVRMLLWGVVSGAIWICYTWFRAK